MQEKRYSAHDAYSTSKLAMMLITAEQSQRLGSHGPTSNCLDPGTVNTALLQKGKPTLLNPKPCNLSRHDIFKVLQTERGIFYTCSAPRYHSRLLIISHWLIII